MTFAAAAALGYLLGSIPFGYLLGRWRAHLDIRRYGSGNIGATNVARLLGWKSGLATLALDAAKGALAVFCAGTLPGATLRTQLVAGLAAILGHLFPIWLRFHGGKGVATMFGVFAMVAWQATLATLALWVVVAAIWRYASLSSMIAAAALPLSIYWLYAPGHHPPLALSLTAAVVALLVLWRHRENLRRLVAGQEPRLRWKSGR